MSQTFTSGILADLGIPTSIDKIGENLDSLRSGFSGTTAPATPAPVAGQQWYDTVTKRSYIYNGTVWTPICGDLVRDVTSVANSTTSEETLKTYTLPALLDIDAKGIEIEAILLTAANGNNKAVKLKFGATEIRSTGNVAMNAKYIRVTGRVFRTGAATQLAVSEVDSNDGTLLADTEPVMTTPAETLSGTVAVALRVTCAAASDISCKLWRIRILE